MEKGEASAVPVHSADTQWCREPSTCTHVSSRHVSLDQWFSTFLMLQPFNTVPHVVTPNDKIILLLLQNYSKVTVIWPQS